ncbi:MAG: glutamate racemase [Anaerolineae bacterium]|nr:glutamate racemase [Anaerolineae bacterium]
MIGIFDSGVGGLSVLKEIQSALPLVPFIYLADQYHVPYGPRPLPQIRKFTNAACDFLIREGARLIVIACNTASAAALQTVREQHPQIPFVGLVPAVKPAAERTVTGRIAVLATPGTFHGRLYITVKNKHAQNVIVYQDTVPGLVEQIEKGELATEPTRAILNTALLPLLSKQIDKVVLGCTHYPFVSPLIREIVGDQIELIDPAPAIARRVQYLLQESGISVDTNPSGIHNRYISTDPNQTLGSALHHLLGFRDATIEVAEWQPDGQIASSPRTC